MERSHPPGEKATHTPDPEAEGSPPERGDTSVREASPARDGDGATAEKKSGRGDPAFMEEVLAELSAQNDHAAGDKKVEGESARPRTVRVTRDQGFRTPEGVASARAYLPARTVSPGQTAPVDAPTVKVEDPRRLPTVRLPRQRIAATPAEGKGRAARGLASKSIVSEDTSPTLRSAAGAVLPKPKRASLSRWTIALIVAAIAGVVLVALAARYLPARMLPGAPSPGSSATP